MMKLDHIYLDDSECDKLAELLERYNEGRPFKSQKTFQEYAEGLLRDAIYHEWKLSRRE